METNSAGLVQILPEPGWVEHSPMEIWEKTQLAMDLVVRPEALRGGELAALGITNQRETTVVWDRQTGAPLCNAVVWQDVRSQQAVDGFRRSGDVRRVRDVTGLPVSTYFSAVEGCQQFARGTSGADPSEG